MLNEAAGMDVMAGMDAALSLAAIHTRPVCSTSSDLLRPETC
jgi:hypothetical protein